MDMQRRHPRTRAEIAVHFARTQADRHTIVGFASNLSLGGMFITTDVPLPLGTQVVVRLSVPGVSQLVGAHGVVRWTNAEGMGVQFAPCGPRETYFITQLNQIAKRAGAGKGLR
jgi:uncharacterized protein (TIGR02266 family)